MRLLAKHKKKIKKWQIHVICNEHFDKETSS